jgi:hypothetical protein
MNFTRDIIRCELYPDEITNSSKFVNVKTGRTPAMYKGAQVTFQFAVVRTRGEIDTDMELYGLEDMVGLPKMRIRSSTAAGAVLLDESTADEVLKDITLDVDSWEDGTKQHFTFSFPETATSIAVGTHWIVIYGPDDDVFGVSQIEVIDPGTGVASSPSPSDPTYYTAIDVDGKLTDYQKKVLDIDEPIILRALNPATNQLGRITLQAIWDDQGLRLVQTAEDITP